jgi:hypothetical protein
MTGDTKFTPGPWYLSSHTSFIRAEGPKGFNICAIEEQVEWPGNAHLIAAAPELYEALEKMANAHHAGADELRSFARAALKKARGEP